VAEPRLQPRQRAQVYPFNITGSSGGMITGSGVARTSNS
jgi:hypothetical protein